jgi:hypothetical protein
MVAPPADARARLRIGAASGRVTVIAESRADIVDERGGSQQVAEDGTVEVRPRRRSDAVAVRCPIGADVVVGTQSGGVELVGQFGVVGVTSHSGSINVAAVASADLRTVSGRVEVEDCAGHCRISTTSGRITVGTSGDAEISTTSGKVRIGGVDGSAQLRSVSGSVHLVSSGRGPIRISTVSGTIEVRLPSGMRPDVRASGKAQVKGEFEPGDDVQVEVAAISGTVRLVTS